MSKKSIHDISVVIAGIIVLFLYPALILIGCRVLETLGLSWTACLSRLTYWKVFWLVMAVSCVRNILCGLGKGLFGRNSAEPDSSGDDD